MVLFDGVVGLLMLGLWIFCVIDVITAPEAAVRNLPKLAWIVIVVLLFDIGSIAWLVAGRPWNVTGDRVRTGMARTSTATPRARSRARPTNPDDDEEFLASLRARAEEQRRAREQGEQPPAE